MDGWWLADHPLLMSQFEDVEDGGMEEGRRRSKSDGASRFVPDPGEVVAAEREDYEERA